ncbi:hypothetical protein FRAHR75_290038 [Frankia sp. Hr75.2]|nr:hypothetical protein FRAHR75_290038 [Frankia sp. Hr75.2]SQD95298.1 conserved hypothetical protein [Parafrankia sp. Ea1.12]
MLKLISSRRGVKPDRTLRRPEGLINADRFRERGRPLDRPAMARRVPTADRPVAAPRPLLDRRRVAGPGGR